MTYLDLKENLYFSIGGRLHKMSDFQTTFDVESEKQKTISGFQEFIKDNDIKRGDKLVAYVYKKTKNVMYLSGWAIVASEFKPTTYYPINSLHEFPIFPVSPIKVKIEIFTEQDQEAVSTSDPIIMKSLNSESIILMQAEISLEEPEKVFSFKGKTLEDILNYVAFTLKSSQEIRDFLILFDAEISRLKVLTDLNEDTFDDATNLFYLRKFRVEVLNSLDSIEKEEEQEEQAKIFALENRTPHQIKLDRIAMAIKATEKFLEEAKVFQAQMQEKEYPSTHCSPFNSSKKASDVLSKALIDFRRTIEPKKDKK